MRPLIVLADDSAELRALLAGALERVGYRVVQVGTGAALIDEVHRLVAEGEHVRLIITDVRMPGLSGVDAATAIRAAGLEAPLIFMTAFGDAWTRARAEQLGAVLLDKPLGLSVLRSAVQRAIVEAPGQL
jgi:CheY-like chemotaxis protein